MDPPQATYNQRFAVRINTLKTKQAPDARSLSYILFQLRI
ncbi:hypothetical protein DEALK_14720 [Dehalogenimonas alkenigignens]|uniref:Uncharacterized protein n=1 Tax=Dehalogenimonas alkenigignens TaxID=1217799 RepID=A0A0W0GJC8_9CHLR|nr:hypothetical protein DEALK_14720 [Dehalogenimonas alkenigignens]